MAILRGVASLMIGEHLRRPFRGNLLQLGRQEILFGRDDLARILRRHGMTPANREALDRIEDGARPLTDREFFAIFGFDRIAALDHEDAESADVTLDLNAAATPEAQLEAWDCIYDGGTTEHVFNVPNLLANVARMLATGGRAVHANPSSNSVDHGFYSISPCLYYEYYEVNGFRVDDVKLLDLGTRLLPTRVRAYDYLPPLPRSLLDGYLNGHVHYVFAVATKQPGATWDRVPQQRFYREQVWAQSAADPGAGPARARGLLPTLKRVVKARPRLERAIRTYGVPFFRLPRVLGTRWRLSRLGRRF